MQISKDKYNVSVIMTIYNRKKLISRALNSLLKQTYKDFEVIIIDDGSTDGVENILIPFAKKFGFIKYLRHSNRHTALSLNTGLHLAEGKYITFLDSDDEYKPSHLKLRIDFMRRNPDVDLLHSPAELIGSEKDMWVTDANNKNKLIHLKDCVIGATIFGKQKIFTELNGFRNTFSYDSDFINRAVKKYNVKRFEYTTYVYYRDTHDSVLTMMKNNKTIK